MIEAILGTEKVLPSNIACHGTRVITAYSHPTHRIGCRLILEIVQPTIDPHLVIDEFNQPFLDPIRNVVIMHFGEQHRMFIVLVQLDKGR